MNTVNHCKPGPAVSRPTLVKSAPFGSSSGNPPLSPQSYRWKSQIMWKTHTVVNPTT